MSRLIESIKIYNGRVYNIKWHNQRCNNSRKELFGCSDLVDLRKAIVVPNQLKLGLVKCRVLYDRDIQSVEYARYEIRTINKLKVVSVVNVSYLYKFEDRSELSNIRNTFPTYDEIIMVRKGLITDAYYYNIIIEKDNNYFTPKYPLLNGVMRSYLIDKSMIIPTDLTVQDIKLADKVHLINALTPIGKITIMPAHIQY